MRLRRGFVLVAALAVVTALPVTVRGEEPAAEVRARNVVRKKLPRDVKSIALEYSVILIDENGNEKPVDPVDHTFQVGDSFLVRFRPQDDLYVYVFNEGPGGERTCLLPEPGETSKFVRRNAEISLPDDGSYFTFQPPAGEEKLIVVALQEPVEDLRLLAGAAFRASGDRAGNLASTPAAPKGSETLEDIRSRADSGTRSRGPVRKIVERLETPLAADQRITHVEPPSEGQTSSYGIAVAGPEAGRPELILDIPLKSRAGK